jgi:hypothetical protein
MYRAPAKRITSSGGFWLRHAWISAFLLGTAATPAAAGLAVSLPAPIGMVLIWPLHGLAIWAGPGLNIGTPERPFYEGTPIHLMAWTLGAGLTWLLYVLMARVVLWRVAVARAERDAAT